MVLNALFLVRLQTFLPAASYFFLLLFFLLLFFLLLF